MTRKVPDRQKPGALSSDVDGGSHEEISFKQKTWSFGSDSIRTEAALNALRFVLAARL
jgi:hypothetical protein